MRDHSGQALSYVYYENESGRLFAARAGPAQAGQLALSGAGLGADRLLGQLPACSVSRIDATPNSLAVSAVNSAEGRVD